MVRRVSPPAVVVAVAALGLVALVIGFARSPGPTGPTVFCAAALRPAMEATASTYEKENGTRVEFRFGNSESMLAAAELASDGDGDLFLPADGGYVRTAEAKGLVAAAFPLATMRAVVVTRPGNPHHVAGFDDLLKADLKLGQATPDGAAVGKVTRDRLKSLGKWDALEARTHVFLGTVTEAATSVKLGSTDAAVVWDAVAFQFPDLAVVRLPELDGAVGRVELAVLKGSKDPAAARRFAEYVAGDGGRAAFRANGFEASKAGP